MSDSPPLGSVVQLMCVLPTFRGPSWATWRSLLRAAFALELSEADRAKVRELTGRDVLPSSPVRELWLLLGRRSGKSIIAALYAVWATCCRFYTLAPGEVGVFMVVAADRRQARIIKRYVAGLLLVRRGDGSSVPVTATFDQESLGFTLTTVDSDGKVAFGTSIAIGADGLPVVSYWDSSNADLKVAHCGNLTCTAGNVLTTVDSAGSVGLETSIAIGADGLPVMSYWV